MYVVRWRIGPIEKGAERMAKRCVQRQTESEIPPRVRAAMEFVEFCERMVDTQYGRVSLERSFETFHRSALEVLRLYLSGESDFEGTLSMDEPPDGPPEAATPIAVPTPR
jgi:hypothetical protein